MTENDIDAKWKFVEECLMALRERYDAVIGLAGSVVLPCESPLISPLFKTGKDLIEALSLLVGDDGENIDWFVNECDFGRGMMEAGCKEDMRVIDNCGMLRWLVELSCL